ncbi:MAG: hypothetical protein K0S44_53 [Bacteroidetes bacterium]|jgi:hypothetical protein|nr:hypothetical protein [Bacteroidota bacterium]
MKKFFSKRINVIGVILLIAVVTFGFKQVVVLDKVTICHIPPGNSNNCQEITVSLNSLDAHLDHGDDLVCHNPDELDAYINIANDHNLRLPRTRDIMVLVVSNHP